MVSLRAALSAADELCCLLPEQPGLDGGVDDDHHHHCDGFDDDDDEEEEDAEKCCEVESIGQIDTSVLNSEIEIIQ